MNYSSNYSKLLTSPIASSRNLYLHPDCYFRRTVQSPGPRDFRVYRLWDVSLLVGNKLGTSVSKEKFPTDIQGQFLL